MVISQTFFGKAENFGPLSKEEVYFMLSVFQYCPINSATFFLAGLDKVDNFIIGNIYVGGTVTHIALALGLRNQVPHLTPICGYNLLDLYDV